MNELTTHNQSTPTITCFHCDTVTKLYQPNDYVIFACPSCNRISSKNQEDDYKRLKNNWKTSYASLKLYAEGTFEGKKITVAGIALKKNRTSRWTEYHLVDETGDGHILSEYLGHFHYLKFIPEDDETYKPLRKKLDKNCHKFEFEGYEFERYEFNYTNTIAITGEFPYDAINISDVYCADFIAPPYLISIELNKDKTIELFSGYYVSLNEMRTMFPSQTFSYPSSEVMGMAQPILWGLDKKKVNFYGMVGVGILTFFFILFHIFSNENILVIQNIDKIISGNEYISNSFVLEDNIANHYLQFNAQSDVSNSWVEDQITLVNESTGEEREIALGIEYYSGVDNGYSWSEGSTISEVCLSGVPGGKYHIKSKFVTSDVDSYLPFSMTVYDSYPTNWNFGILIVIFGGLIFLFNITYNNLEEKR
jgi:hypothetical protein